MTPIANIQALSTLPRLSATPPPFSVGEQQYGSIPAYSAFTYFELNEGLKNWMGENGNTATTIDMIAAGTPPVNLVTGDNNNYNPSALIASLLQNDVQRSADAQFAADNQLSALLAEVDMEQRRNDGEMLRSEGQRLSKVAELEEYGRRLRGEDQIPGEESLMGPMLPVISPVEHQQGQSEGMSIAAQQYAQGRQDLLAGGVSPLQPIDVSAAPVALPQKQTEQGMSAPSKLGLSAGALALASQCGASINQFTTCKLVAANDIAAPQAVGMRRSPSVSARAA